jgi:hypothetical protein
MLTKSMSAIKLGYESLRTLYLDEWSGRQHAARKLRFIIRNDYFHNRSTIQNLNLLKFCELLGGLDSGRPVKLSPEIMASSDLEVGSPQYFLTLGAIAGCMKAECIVEFGTYLGASALTFALNAPSARVVTIDLPDEAGDLSNLPGVDQHHVITSRYQVGKWYKNTPEESHITELKCDSRELELSKHVQHADLVLVDGGHDTGCITADTRNAFAVTRAGGVVLWDDYCWLYPDVVRFLDKLAKTHELFCIEGTNLVAHVRRQAQ